MAADFITVSSNIPRVKKLFNDLGGLEDELKALTAAAAFEAVKDAKLAVVRQSFDEGTLADSITAQYLPDLGVVYGLFVNVFYGPYVEFGTGTKVDVPEELKDYALQFKGNVDVVGMEARPYLYPAAVDAQSKLVTLIIDFIKKKL